MVTYQDLLIYGLVGGVIGFVYGAALVWAIVRYSEYRQQKRRRMRDLHSAAARAATESIIRFGGWDR